MFLCEWERNEMLIEGIQEDKLNKFRCNAGDKATSGADHENKIAAVYKIQNPS